MDTPGNDGYFILAGRTTSNTFTGDPTGDSPCKEDFVPFIQKYEYPSSFGGGIAEEFFVSTEYKII